jgi:hypothetical protein
MDGTTYTDDTTLDDEYEQQRLDALPEELQELAYKHHLDQFEAVPSYVGRYQQQQEGAA